MTRTRRVLWNLNVSNFRNLAADSAVAIFNSIMLRELPKRPNWHIYVVCPRETPLLKNNRITNIPYQPKRSYNMLSRLGADISEFHDQLNLNQYDYDTIFNNQPEQTVMIFGIFNIIGEWWYRIPVVNYCHWFVCPDTTSIEIADILKTHNHPLAMNALTGFLTGAHTFVNSEWEKNLILNTAQELLSEKMLQFLKSHITPLAPGVNVKGILSCKNTKRVSDKFTILFNHRLDGYTNYKKFLEWMDNLWTKRQDFKVIITDVSAKSETGLHGIQDHLDRPYLEVKAGLAKPDYYSLLWQVDAGVLMHKSWGAWSMSGLDLMAAGKPIISTYDRAFPEMLGMPYPFYFRPDDESSFQEAMIKAMSDKTAYQEASKQVQERTIKLFDWDIMAAKWLDGIEKYGDCEFTNEASERKLDLVEYVKKEKIVSKKQLVQWVGGEVSYTRRRRFLQDNGIKDDPDTPLCEYSFGMTQKRFF